VRDAGAQCRQRRDAAQVFGRIAEQMRIGELHESDVSGHGGKATRCARGGWCLHVMKS
jgi:hypothetical protein